jgi:hypothetical protein
MEDAVAAHQAQFRGDPVLDRLPYDYRKPVEAELVEVGGKQVDEHDCRFSGTQHGHGHHDDPTLQHHFSTKEQQFDASKIGMWLFLTTEILMFGGLFVGFGLMQNKFPRSVPCGAPPPRSRLGALNTIVLLISSFTMVMAVWAASKSKQKQLVIF